MEQKRTLWIVLASGIFLLVVIGVALLLNVPEQEHEAAVSYSSTGSSMWVDKNPSASGSGYVEEVPYEKPDYSQDTVVSEEGMEETPSAPEYTESPYDSPVTETPAERRETTIDITGDEESSVTAKNESTRRTISENLASRRESIVKETSSKENESLKTEIKETVKESAKESKKETSRNNSRETPAAAEKAPARDSGKVSGGTKADRPSAKNTVSSSGKASAKASSGSSKAVKEREPDRFWVQAGSFTSTKKANEARELLTQKGMQCEVFTFKNKEDTLYFRVRIGPYTTKQEADFWKKEIEKIDQFKGAFVTNSTVR